MEVAIGAFCTPACECAVSSPTNKSDVLVLFDEVRFRYGFVIALSIRTVAQRNCGSGSGGGGEAMPQQQGILLPITGSTNFAFSIHPLA